MPTRDRAGLFAEALASILGQERIDLEVIVVNDGSGAEHRQQYDKLAASADHRVRFIHLARRPRGHGQAYALNVGVSVASQPYVTFLDDDDTWTDPAYLARTAATLAAADGKVDLHMSNQAAFAGATHMPGPVWIESLSAIVEADGTPIDPDGTYAVSVEQLLRCTGFCHVNTLVVRRALYEDIGGMDEAIRWECDRDLYLRLIDRAELIRYAPWVISRHNIPDPAAQSSMTTSLSMLDRRLYQLRVLDKAAIFAAHSGIRAHGRRHKGYALKKIAEELAELGRYRDAAPYAAEALGALPTIKWGFYTSWLALRARIC